MIRSPTAEDLFRGNSKYNVKSAGILNMSYTKVTQKLINWADIIFVFSEKDDKHFTYLKSNFNFDSKKIIDLDTPNIYNERGAPELVKLLKGKLADYLD